MSKKLLTFCFLFFVSANLWSAEETVTTGTDAGGHTLVPVGANATALGGASVNFATQQLYLASELGGEAKAGDITAISFHYKTGTNYFNARSSWKLYINTTSETDLEANQFLDEGTLVYSSTSFNVPSADEWYKLDFTSGFAWNGKDNIVITIIDESNTTMPTGKSHWAYTTSAARSIYLRKGFDEEIPNPLAGTTSTRKDSYVANAKFTIYLPDVSAPATPSDLAVSATSSNSATLAWSAVVGATSYDLEQSENGSDWTILSSGVTATSFDWTGLEAASTQYARIRANNAIGSSDWSDAVEVKTDEIFEYKDITFEKWTSTSSLPTSGNYYLADDVAFDWLASDVVLDGDLNLCLNGKTADIFFLKIIVPSGHTLAIYDNVGSGKITGVVASEVGSNENYVTSLIVVKSGGTLVLKEGAIENNYDPDSDGSSYAIYSNGALIIADAPVINSKAVDIFLSTMGLITLDGAISNSEKYTIDKYAGTIVTSGWTTHMGDAKPSDYFVHVDEEKTFSITDGEVNIIKKDDTPTAIETIINDQSPITNKVIENGLIIIFRDGNAYNVMGQQVR